MSHPVITCLALPPHMNNRRLTPVAFPVDKFFVFFFLCVSRSSSTNVPQKQGAAEGSRSYPAAEYFQRMIKSIISRFLDFPWSDSLSDPCWELHVLSPTQNCYDIWYAKGQRSNALWHHDVMKARRGCQSWSINLRDTGLYYLLASQCFCGESQWSLFQLLADSPTEFFTTFQGHHQPYHRPPASPGRTALPGVPQLSDMFNLDDHGPSWVTSICPLSQIGGLLRFSTLHRALQPSSHALHSSSSCLTCTFMLSICLSSWCLKVLSLKP